MRFKHPMQKMTFDIISKAPSAVPPLQQGHLLFDALSLLFDALSLYYDAQTLFPVLFPVVVPVYQVNNSPA